MKEPKQPDANGYQLVGGVAGFAVCIFLMPRGEWWALLAGCMVWFGWMILYLRAQRIYKNTMELYTVWKRAQPIALPDPFTIYTIRGTLSMRNANGDWMDIGEGAGTFHIKPQGGHALTMLPDGSFVDSWRAE